MIAIIDYGVGNLFSVEKAFAALGAEAKITNNPAEIKAAEKLVLPGVGASGQIAYPLFLCLFHRFTLVFPDSLRMIKCKAVTVFVRQPQTCFF